MSVVLHVLQPRAYAAEGGHSLGGAFALLMACMARVRMGYDPNAIRCYAFGAPPVLSLSEKTAAQNVMSVRSSLLGALPSFPLHAHH